jgi:hypothetical protein
MKQINNVLNEELEVLKAEARIAENIVELLEA